ncbi:response regulator receiver protein [Pseudoxanthomonas broegbernensis]|uniref:Response regulator receiver protein n=1 Tax=Pseudoxanthomonas broegbernensis TaxID=83619 RepID=A0A7V8K7N7_9GAMM|nr:EAL domain-containing response regulator [Pseudoxanthomonas broegbernensis]KAF1687387.1 response regulator receiver protein [Pseudoxanthomonas broegbernensis]MBB6065823.1 EAL domain-containing protein (putative c-di-GMP-specific phosphodiesterase class I)/PleD family two-component response regulator [Pseudoxanthomonas broegbernensis]
MVARDSAPTSDEPAARQRARAEVPPPHYWRRWVPDAEEQDEAAVPEAADTAAGAGPAAADTEAPYRILIVEDDRSQALFAQSVLHGAGMQAQVQMESAGVLEAIDQFQPDLILMDLHMPGLDGMRLTTLIRERPGFQLLPIVFLTGDPDPERQFEVLESGADDFLTKPVRPRHLIAAVSNRIQRSRAQLRQSAAAPAAMRSNPETGLATRAWLLQQLDDALQADARGGVFFIEIAGALSLREHYGYAAFERLMAEAGRRLAQIAAPAPLARLNDNSFLIVSRDADPAGLKAVAAGVRTRLAMENFLIRDDERIQLRSAIGYAALSQGFEDAGSALEATERSALQARLESDGVAAYVPPSDHEAQERLALLEGQIELAYQPIVSVAGNDQAQYQVLMRLRQPDGTLLSAGQVIPAAEASGRIADLDQQVMEHALNLVAQRAAQGTPLRLFVSQSPRTLAREAFADWLLQAIAERGIAGTSVVIDIRLADALIHSVTLGGFCHRLMPAGVQFCLGQFEPGDEADALLGQMPLGYVRMAGRFAGAHNDGALRDQLRTVIEQAHRQGLQVIGQQIEDPQAAAAMWVAGIDFVQGNLVSSVGSDLDFDFKNAVL